TLCQRPPSSPVPTPLTTLQHHPPPQHLPSFPTRRSSDLELFPALQTPILLTEPDELEEAERFVTTPQKTRAALTAQLARFLRGYKMEDDWWDVLEWYIRHDTKESATYHVLQRLSYENKPVD